MTPTIRAATGCTLLVAGFVAAKQKPAPRFEHFRVSAPLPKREAPAVIGRPENETDAEFDKHIRDFAVCRVRGHMNHNGLDFRRSNPIEVGKGRVEYDPMLDV